MPLAAPLLWGWGEILRPSGPESGPNHTDQVPGFPSVGGGEGRKEKTLPFTEYLATAATPPGTSAFLY